MEANPNELNINAPKRNLVILDGANILSGAYNVSSRKEKIMRPDYEKLIRIYAPRGHDGIHFFSPNKLIHEDNIELLHGYFKILKILGGKRAHAHLNPTGKHRDEQQTDRAIEEYLHLIIRAKFAECIIIASDDGGFYPYICYALDVGIRVIVLQINIVHSKLHEDKRIQIEEFPLYEKTPFDR